MACSGDRSPEGRLHTHWGKGQAGVWEASLEETPGILSGSPFSLPGDILALVFGLLFAATSIAFLLQLRRQHRYLWPSLGTAFFRITQNSRTANELSFGVGFSDSRSLFYRHRSGTKDGVTYSPAEMTETGA